MLLHVASKFVVARLSLDVWLEGHKPDEFFGFNLTHSKTSLAGKIPNDFAAEFNLYGQKVRQKVSARVAMSTHDLHSGPSNDAFQHHRREPTSSICHLFRKRGSFKCSSNRVMTSVTILDSIPERWPRGDGGQMTRSRTGSAFDGTNTFPHTKTRQHSP